MDANPIWTPKTIETTRMWQFLLFANKKFGHNFKNYPELYQWSIDKPAQFWQSLSEFFSISWNTPAKEILNAYDHMIHAKWFHGATFNFAEKLLSRRDKHPAIISLNENNDKQVLSYEMLYEQVASCAKALENAGVRKGDRVAAVMPNVPATIIAMLATTSLGAIWSSCSPDFGAQAIIDRFSQIAPKILFICDGQQYQGKKHEETDKIAQVSAAIPSIETLIICPILSTKPKIKNAVYWDDFLIPRKECSFQPFPFAHPVYILFSSGTTGKPKCIVHGAGGTLLQHFKELGLHCNVSSDDNLFFYTTCGWMMWNWMVSTLALGATITLYEGAPTFPDANHLFQIIEQEKVSIFGTSAKFISAVEKAAIKPGQSCDLSTLRTILSTGSPLLPKNYDFVYEHIKSDIQLCSISGGTDIVSCFALGNPILPVHRGELQCIGLGMAVEVFDEAGESVTAKRGELVCTKAFPSMPIGFWNDPHNQRYKKAYFERFANIWAHGDFAEITKHQGLIIYGRSDAVLNPGGVRIGTAEIYRQVEKIPDIMDSIVIAQEWQDDVRIVLFVKLRNGMRLSDPLCEQIRQTIRRNASPRHVPAKILQVSDIPRTMSGKIVEVAVRQVVHGEAVHNLSSLANPESLKDFQNRTELSG